MKKEKKRVLVVDDRKNTLKVLAAILSDDGYSVVMAQGPHEALSVYRQKQSLDAVISDLKMPGMDGVELFRAMNKIKPPPPFIIMTAYGTIKSAVSALKEGISNYLIKPLDYEELLIVLKKAIDERQMSEELSKLKSRLSAGGSFHGIIGESGQMKQIFSMVETIGPTDVSVLICGETGTGKELLARAIHMESLRKDSKMICINSAAIADNLLEAELFGYVRGAFTGAVSDRKGRLMTAHKGTLFLDEIGQMSLSLQAKLLRFLQEQTFEPVGSNRTEKVDVRIIAATNLDLQTEIQKGRFLKDLYYRIEVVRIDLPPLRTRREDIYLLASHFIEKYSLRFKKEVEGISPEALEILIDYSWPGNVRELENYIARGILLSKGEVLGKEDLPGNLIPEKKSGDYIQKAGKKMNLKEMEKILIRQTLADCGGNKSKAAARLGISRKSLYEKMSRYKIVPA